MNEMDLEIQEKIKKREKTDIFLAYMLIIILLGAIFFVVYLKFIKNNKASDNNTTEYVANYIKLDDVASFVLNNLNNKYNGITTSVKENAININYGDITYNVKLLNNELEFKMNNDNSELSKDIYKEVVTSICSYYHNDIDGCKNSADNIKFGENTNGIRFVDQIMYISITNSIAPSEIEKTIAYNTETITSIDETDYKLNINDKTITDIKIEMIDTNITIKGTASDKGIITVKLYDASEQLLEKKSVNGDTNFSITFEYNDKINIDNIKKYSINIE